MRLWIVLAIFVIMYALCIDAVALPKDQQDQSGDSTSSASQTAEQVGEKDPETDTASLSSLSEDNSDGGNDGVDNEAKYCAAPQSQEYEVSIKVNGKIGDLVRILKAVEKADKPSTNCGKNKEKAGTQDGSDEDGEKESNNAEDFDKPGSTDLSKEGAPNNNDDNDLSNTEENSANNNEADEQIDEKPSTSQDKNENQSGQGQKNGEVERKRRRRRR